MFINKNLRILIIVIGLLLVVSGCGLGKYRPEVMIASDMVYYNMDGSKDFGFNIVMLSKNQETQVDVLQVYGSNTERLSIQYQEDTYAQIRDMKRKGYYIHLLGFVCETADDYVEITGMDLKVDGREKKLVFPQPLKHTISQAESPGITIRGIPAFVMTNSLIDDTIEFSYEAEEDIRINDFRFNDFLQVKDAIVLLNGEEMGKMKEVLPLDVSKGMVIAFRCTLERKDTSATAYDNLYCDSMLQYELSGSGKEYILPFNIVCQGVSNEEDADVVLKLLLNRDYSEVEE